VEAAVVPKIHILKGELPIGFVVRKGKCKKDKE